MKITNLMKNIFYALLPLLFFVACTSEEPQTTNPTPDDTPTNTPSISLDQTRLDFDEQADSQTIYFTSAMDWTAELINDRADSWCSISATSGKSGNGQITVSVTENTSTDDRTASIIIKSGPLSRTVRISQKQKDALTVTTSRFEVESTRGKIYIEVKANIDFEYTINGSAANWITPIETRAMKTTKLGFNIAENSSFSNREGTITFHSGNMQEVVTVYQKGNNDVILISQNEFIVSDEGEDIAIEVTSNLDVAIEMPDVDWITRNTSRAVSTNTYYFTIAENSAHQQREAYITFTNKAKNISEKVKITQKNLIVCAKNEYLIEKAGGVLDFDIQTNAEVSVSISEDAKSWITHVTSRALQTQTLHFDIAANDSDDTREGVITLSSDGVIHEITIQQTGYIKLGTPNKNEIYYTSKYKEIIQPNMDYWNETIVSNIYDKEKGYGIITFEGDIEDIGKYTFQECSSLTSITIPNSVTVIGGYAFMFCSSLTSITMPDSVTTIVDGAFYDCSSLTSIAIPESVTSIGRYAFVGCSSLEAFYGKYTSEDNRCLIINGELNSFAPAGLTTYNIPEGVTSIREYAFHNCNALTSITIPNSVSKIESKAFLSCHSLEAFYSKYSSEDNRCLIIDGTLNSFACAGLTTYNIPVGITAIGNLAFHDCNTLTSITIPEEVTTIGEEAFSLCSSLKSITIPNGVTTIGAGVFYYCNALSSATIGNGVTSIGEFTFYGCSSLSSVYCKATTPPTLGDNAFGINATDCKIYVPEKSVDAYKSAEGWCDYADCIVSESIINQYQGTLPILNKESAVSKMLKEWDKGGEGVGYHDLSNRNGGTPDVEGGGNIGYTTSGEWLAYTVYVKDAGTYRFTLYGSSSAAAGSYGGEYQWFLDDPYIEENALGPRFKQQSGGAWGGPWMPSEPVEFELKQGYQRIILYMHNGVHNLYNFTAEWAE